MSGDHHTDATTARRVRRLETLLEEKGLITGERLDEAIDAFLAESSPANGARVVARAWTDDAYRARLLADGTAAVQELGHMEGSYQRLRVVENTESVHNVIVCTLCSCYPLRLLGPSPSWYKSEAYRSPRGPRTPCRPAGVRPHPARLRGRRGVGLQRGDPLHGPAAQASGHRRTGRGGAGGAGDEERPHRYGRGVTAFASLTGRPWSGTSPSAANASRAARTREDEK